MGSAQGLIELCDGACKNFAEHLIVPTVQRLAEIRVNGEAVELHCWVVLLVAKILQLRTKVLYFRGGEWVEHSVRKISPEP
jgi:hypothetical protein